MLKLSSRSAAVVLIPNRKISEFFQPRQSTPVSIAIDSADLDRPRRDNTITLVSVQNYNRTDASIESKHLVVSGKRQGMAALEPETVSRKRTRDGKTPDRSSVRTSTEAGLQDGIYHDNIGTNGDVVPTRRAVAPAAPLAEKNEATTKKTSEEKRSLRSKDGTQQLKSELVTFFPNYKEIMAGEILVEDYLLHDEPIQITDSEQATRGKAVVLRAAPIEPPTDYNGYQRIDLMALLPHPIDRPTIDPLDDSYYLPSHRRAERREKQQRNIEKERAQHEKGQLEALLNSLQGPDWLRVIGVTGVVEGARKEYESKRDCFIREVRVLLKKFSIWKEAEKKLALEKAARDEEEEEDDAEEEADGSEIEDHDLSIDDPDAWAARQLRIEARSARSKRKKPEEKIKIRIRLPPRPITPEPPKPFTSFFDKPHLRQVALSKGRHSVRRTVLAFGHPVPEPNGQEFYLPEGFMSKETMLANARKKRRLNRERKEKEAELEIKAKREARIIAKASDHV